MLCVSLLFPSRNLEVFRRFLDPHFSPTEVYEVYVVSVNLETIISKRQGPGRVRLLIQPLVDLVISSDVTVFKALLNWYHTNFQHSDLKYLTEFDASIELFKDLRKTDPYMIEHMDTYSNILYVKVSHFT